MKSDIKKVFLFSLGVFFYSGCAPKIISDTSPINKLDESKCFNLPSNDFLSKNPIYKQKLYQLTSNSLNKNNIAVFYGESSKCKNYLSTVIKFLLLI